MANSYRFGDDRQISILLGLGARQVVPLAGGFVWLALWLQAGAAPIGAVGLAVCLIAGFGRWRGFALAEIAGPAARHLARRRGGGVWVRHSLLATGEVGDVDVPVEFDGLELIEIPAPTLTTSGRGGLVGVVHDLHARTVSGREPGTADESRPSRRQRWGSVRLLLDRLRFRRRKRPL